MENQCRVAIKSGGHSTDRDASNLSNFGGRTADVGLAGFTIGGGLTALGPKYGLALDNVSEYEVRSGTLLHTPISLNFMWI